MQHPTPQGEPRHIVIERVGGVAVIVLSNPPMNVVTLHLTRQLYAALNELAADRRIGAVVVTGAGDRAFCAGSDITELVGMRAPGAVLEKKLVFQNMVFQRLRNFPKPTIAALNGFTFGGGLEIALCCDLLIAESQVRVAVPEIKLGVFPSSGGTFRLAKRIGEARAKELVFLGEAITAARAHEWGLVNRVVDERRARVEAIELARSLARGPRLALEMAKSVINVAFDRSDAEALTQSLNASEKVFCSEDAAEGVDAFLAKRAPAFSVR